MTGLFVAVLFTLEIAHTPFEVCYLLVVQGLRPVRLLGPIGHSCAPAGACLYQRTVTVEAGLDQIEALVDAGKSVMSLRTQTLDFTVQTLADTGD